MLHQWERLEARPEMPASLTLPPRELVGLEWHRAVAQDGHTLVTTFTGDGTPDAGGVFVVWLYVIPPEGESARLPELLELYDASGLVEVGGAMFQLPPFVAGTQMPEGRLEGVLVQARQCGAVHGTAAHFRFASKLAEGVRGGGVARGA